MCGHVCMCVCVCACARNRRKRRPYLTLEDDLAKIERSRVEGGEFRLGSHPHTLTHTTTRPNGPTHNHPPSHPLTHPREKLRQSRDIALLEKTLARSKSTVATLKKDLTQTKSAVLRRAKNCLALEDALSSSEATIGKFDATVETRRAEINTLTDTIARNKDIADQQHEALESVTAKVKATLSTEQAAGLKREVELADLQKQLSETQTSLTRTNLEHHEERLRLQADLEATSAAKRTLEQEHEDPVVLVRAHTHIHIHKHKHIHARTHERTHA